MNLGDYTLEDTVTCPFTTRAFATGIPAALATGEVQVYEDDSVTQITTAETLTASIDSVVGFNMVSVAATAANGFENGKSYTLMLSAGTVSSVSVVGEVVGHFTIGRGAAAVDLANVTDGLTALKTAIDAIPTTAMRGTDNAALASVATEARLATLQSLSDETRDANVLDQFKRTIAMLEHQRGWHTHQPIGNVLFVDPTNGDTHANGNRGGITDPYLGVQDCHDNAVTDSNHDVIILLSGAAAGATTLTEDVTLSKRYLSIRGPGRDFIWTRSGSGDTIAITADGISLEGFQVNTAATGAGNGITGTSADFLGFRNLWLNNTQGDAIELTDCDNPVIEDCELQASGQSGSGHGIQILAGAAQTGNYGKIWHNKLHDIAGDAVQIDTTGGGTVDAMTVAENIIEGATGDGVDIVDSNCTSTLVLSNKFGNISGSDINDSGTSTVSLNNEQWSTAANLALIPTTPMRGTDGANTTAPDNAGIADIQSRLPAALVNSRMDATVDGTGMEAAAAQVVADLIIPKTNTALSNIEFLMVDETDFTTPETGLTVAGTRSIDGGAFGAVTGTITEVANGIYQLDASQADMNGSIITFRFTSAGAADRFLTIRTSG